MRSRGPLYIKYSLHVSRVDVTFFIDARARNFSERDGLTIERKIDAFLERARRAVGLANNV